jgi:hypothetical protein
MRWILTGACLLLCAGCSSDSSPDLVSGGASCAARITWNGTVYYGEAGFGRLPSTLMLGTGGRPTCRDSNGGEAGASTTVDVRRLAGVGPRVAVAVGGEPNVAYLARGYFIQLASHPLHAALEWSPRSLNELTGCAKSPPMRLEGIARPGGALVVEVSKRDEVASRYVGHEAFLFVDSYTQIEGFSRNGLPYIGPGTRVAVEAVACLWRNGTLRKVVPRRISPA